jgi:AcrR family transcriptional regulator
MASKATSPRRSAQRLSATDRRRTILEAALGLFAVRGYEGASVDDIAAEAGITVAVIYSHFKSKEELHATVLEEQWQSLLAYQGPRVLEKPAGQQRIREAYASFFEWCQANPLAWRLVFREVGGPPAVVAAHERVLALLTQGIVALLASEDPADPRLAAEPGIVIVAEWIKGGMNAVARWWYDHPDVDRDEIVQLLLDMTWEGLKPLGVEGKKRPARARRGAARSAKR